MPVPGFSMRVSDDGHRVWARWEPGADLPPFDIDNMRDLLAEEGFAGCVVDESAIEQLLASAKAADRAIERAIATRRDGSFAISLSDDLMEARLTLERPRGGKAVTRNEIVDGLREAGVTSGVIESQINEALAAGVATGRVVARGEAPVDGVDTQFELLVAEADERRPQVDETGMFDIRNLGVIPGVMAGTVVMRRVAAQPGVNGFDVRGRVLKAKQGRSVGFAAKLRGVVPDADDPDLLRATITGRPTRIYRGVHVDPAIDFPAVDMSTGHVDFDGSVTVLGDVQPLMKIRASGDVIVHGTVTAAEIEAGGQVVLLGGLMGAAKDADDEEVRKAERTVPRGRVTCGGRFHAMFAEYAVIEAGEDIVVDDHLMFSDLKAGRHVVVGTGAGKGHVIGGSIVAVGQINVGTLGSAANAQTCVQVGLDDTHRQNLEHLDAEIAACESDGATGGALDLMRDEAEALRRRITVASHAHVAVSRKVYPGARVRIGRQRWTATDEVGNGIFRLFEDAVRLFRN